MIKKINYLELPVGFLHCFNASCEFASSCVRYQAGCMIPKTRSAVMAVNPILASSEEKCSEFLSDESILYCAYGIDHLYDNLLYTVAVDIKRQLLSAWGKNMYYRFKRREKPLTPKDQEFVYGIFKEHGVKEKPRFDYYEENYKWMKR